MLKVRAERADETAQEGLGRIGVKDVLPTQELIDQLAERIERAYTLRRQRWCRGCSTRRVWSAAALRLWQAHVDDPQLPLDCELYVASQVINESLSDPWSELAQPAGRSSLPNPGAQDRPPSPLRALQGGPAGREGDRGRGQDRPHGPAREQSDLPARILYRGPSRRDARTRRPFRCRRGRTTSFLPALSICEHPLPLGRSLSGRGTASDKIPDSDLRSTKKLLVMN